MRTCLVANATAQFDIISLLIILEQGKEPLPNLARRANLIKRYGSDKREFHQCLALPINSTRSCELVSI
jgi:phosphopantetheine adenylyltransferase